MKSHNAFYSKAIGNLVVLFLLFLFVTNTALIFARQCRDAGIKHMKYPMDLIYAEYNQFVKAIDQRNEARLQLAKSQLDGEATRYLREIKFGIQLAALGEASFGQLLPAVDLALRKMLNTSFYRGVRFVVVPAPFMDYLGCDSLACLDLLQQVNVMLGPTNDFTLAACLRYSRAVFNVPFVVSGGQPQAFSNRLEYQHLTRLSFSYSDFEWLYSAMFKEFGWDKNKTVPIGVYAFREEKSKSLTTYQYQGLFQRRALMKLFLNSKYDFKEIGHTDEKLENNQLADTLPKIARIAILCTDPDDTRKLMLEVHDKHLTNGDYVFINFDTSSDEEYLRRPWYRDTDSNEVNDKAKQAYRSLLLIMLREFDSPDYLNFTTAVRDRAKRHYNYTFKPEEIDDKKMHSFLNIYYESVVLYLTTLRDVLQSGGNITDGLLMTRSMRNRTLEGVAGEVALNSQGDRLSDFQLLDMDPNSGEFKIVANLFSNNQSIQFKTGRTIDWNNAGNKPPLAIPPCDFDGSACRDDKFVRLYIIASVVFLVILIGSLIAGFIFYRRTKFQAELNAINWKVPWNAFKFQDDQIKLLMLRSPRANNEQAIDGVSSIIDGSSAVKASEFDALLSGGTDASTDGLKPSRKISSSILTKAAAIRKLSWSTTGTNHSPTPPPLTTNKVFSIDPEPSIIQPSLESQQRSFPPSNRLRLLRLLSTSRRRSSNSQRQRRRRSDDLATDDYPNASIELASPTFDGGGDIARPASRSSRGGVLDSGKNSQSAIDHWSRVAAGVGGRVIRRKHNSSNSALDASKQSTDGEHPRWKKDSQTSYSSHGEQQLEYNDDDIFYDTHLYGLTAYYKGSLVSIKCLRRTSIVDPSRDLLLEVKKIRNLANDHICRFIGVCVDAPFQFVVTEYCPKGSLRDLLQDEQFTMDWMFKFSFIQDVAGAVSYLHQSFGPHGSLKSPNCVVDSRFKLKLTDFGIPQVRDPKETGSSSSKYKGLLWTAPEMLPSDDGSFPAPTFKGDVYSFAIICQEVIYRKGVFYLEEEEEKEEEQGEKGEGANGSQEKNKESQSQRARRIVRLVHESKTPAFRPTMKVHDECIGQLVDLIVQCWDEDVNVRPDFRRIKETLRECNKNDSASENLVANVLLRMEQYAHNLEEKVADRTKLYRDLLYSMLPSSVATNLVHNQTVKAESFEMVTIYFSDIVGFTSLSAASTPMQIVQLLNDLYTMFDSIIENYDAYKVETIGDAYMVASGLPKENENRHAREIARMAIAFLNGIFEFKIAHRPEKRLELRIGIHSGPVCAGVVGKKMPRYCLFGDTVNTASRMESNGMPMKIHISEKTFEILNLFETFTMSERGTMEIKGKGDMKTYLLHGENSEIVDPVPTGSLVLSGAYKGRYGPIESTRHLTSSSSTDYDDLTSPSSHHQQPSYQVLVDDNYHAATTVPAPSVSDNTNIPSSTTTTPLPSSSLLPIPESLSPASTSPVSERRSEVGRQRRLGFRYRQGPPMMGTMASEEEENEDAQSQPDEDTSDNDPSSSGIRC